MLVERLSQGRPARPPGSGALVIAARQSHGFEGLKRREQEPAEPNAFAAALLADAVHAVIPVAGSDQGQTVRAGRQIALEPQYAMRVERCSLLQYCRQVEGVVLAILKFAPFEEWHLFIENRGVARGRDVMQHAIGKPDGVVTTPSGLAYCVLRYITTTGDAADSQSTSAIPRRART